MLKTLVLTQADLDRLLEWDQLHPTHFIRIINVITLRWHDRYVVLVEVSESESVWLSLMFA